MKIVAHRGTRLHAPENSRAALVSAYVAGADVLEFDLQLTKDDKLVLSHDGSTLRVTGKDLKIIDSTLADLKKLDWSETFEPPNSPGFKYFIDPEGGERLLAPLTFPTVLDALPEDVEILLELKHDSSPNAGARDKFVKLAIEGLRSHGAINRTVVYSKDPENIKLARALAPGLRIAAFDFEKSPPDQLELLKTSGADGLVTDLDSVFAGNQLTPFGEQLKALCAARNLKLGAILYPFRTPGIFSESEFEALRKEEFVWSISTDSMLAVSKFVRRAGPEFHTDFAGTAVDRENFALGYAKANGYAEVSQDNGIHVVIKDYDQPFPPPPADPVQRKLRELDHYIVNVAKEWPYYSGGGVGYLPGVRGNFSAEMTYTVEKVGQATTLEMAVLNVDPGAHVGHVPRSFRDKDSFYDPHGAPPYIGVEHDEDDGFRINWNLGSEYDNNQYGRPAGMEKSRAARKCGWSGAGPISRLIIARPSTKTAPISARTTGSAWASPATIR